jgi:hypothetical protein
MVNGKGSQPHRFNQWNGNWSLEGIRTRAAGRDRRTQQAERGKKKEPTVHVTVKCNIQQFYVAHVSYEELFYTTKAGKPSN